MQGPGALQPATGATPNASNNTQPRTLSFIEAGTGITAQFGTGAKHPSPSMYQLSGTGRDIFVLSSARTPKSMLEVEQPATQARDICYLQSPAQRARDFARSNGGPSALTTAQRKRLNARQTKWAVDATAAAAERGAVMREARRCGGGSDSVGADGAIKTVQIACAKPLASRMRAAKAKDGSSRLLGTEHRQLFVNKATGQTFFTAEEAAASRRVTRKAAARTKPHMATELGHVIK